MIYSCFFLLFLTGQETQVNCKKIPLRLHTVPKVQIFVCNLSSATNNLAKNKGNYCLFLYMWLYNKGLQWWKQKSYNTTPFCQPISNLMPTSAVKVKSCFGKTL